MAIFGRCVVVAEDPLLEVVEDRAFLVPIHNDVLFEADVFRITLARLVGFDLSLDTVVCHGTPPSSETASGRHWSLAGSVPPSFDRTRGEFHPTGTKNAGMGIPLWRQELVM